eukprot:2209468-Pleurochrysis_carterae.AAC.2
MWDIPRDPIGCIRSAAMLYVVPVATIVKAVVYMGLRATLRCSHPVATLPSDGGGHTSLCGRT